MPDQNSTSKNAATNTATTNAATNKATTNAATNKATTNAATPKPTKSANSGVPKKVTSSNTPASANTPAFSSRLVPANEVKGYIVMTAIAVIIAFCGVFFIYREGKKEVEKRNTFYIIFGICIASLGSLLMVLTIFFLATRS